MPKFERYLKVSPELLFPLRQGQAQLALDPSNDAVVDANICEAYSKPGHQGVLLYKDRKYKILDCQDCGFIHAVPKPSVGELTQFYEKQFYNQERKKSYFEQQRSQLAWWNCIFDERLSRIEAALGRKGKILDIGCGPGFFLSRAKRRGWSVFGLEPAVDAVHYASTALGIRVDAGQLDSISQIFSREELDVVYSHGVLEHLRDPTASISKIYDLIKPGGLVFTSVANDFNPIQACAVMVKGLRPWWIIPPEHLNYFSVESLTFLHEARGFLAQDIRTSFPIDQFLLMDENYVSDPDLGQMAHKKRVSYEEALRQTGFSSLLEKLEASNAKLGIGRQIDYLGRKDG